MNGKEDILGLQGRQAQNTLLTVHVHLTVALLTLWHLIWLLRG